MRRAYYAYLGLISHGRWMTGCNSLEGMKNAT